MVRNLYWLIGGTLPLLLLASLMLGAADVSLVRLNEQDTFLLLASRVPRTLALVLAGMALAVAGTIMQMLARNAFVEPGTTGTLEAAMLGLVVMNLWLPGAPVIVKMAASCAVAMVSCLLLMNILSKIPLRSPIMVPLIGIMFGGVIGAVTTFIGYRYNLLQSINNWSQGDFSAIMRGRYELLWLGAVLCMLAYGYAHRLTLASLGQSITRNLGVSYRQVMFVGLMMVSLISAVTVVTVGMIPFLGLVVPNLVRLMLGDHLARTLPMVALVGASFVLACDLLARALRHPYEIPLGTLVGLFGSAFFVYLILRQPRRSHAKTHG